jgi:hypothetical protein
MLYDYYGVLYCVSQNERSILWEVIISVILSKKLYMYVCLLPNCFRDTAISLYSSKSVDKEEMLRTVSNTGIYCSSDEVTKLVQFTYYNTFSKILPSAPIHFATRVRTWRVARLYSVQCSVQ